MPTLKIDSLDDIPAAIASLQVAGAIHRIPLLRALRGGQIAHFEVTRDTPTNIAKAFFRLAEKPAVILIGDDDYASTGPAGWPAAPKLLAWARVVFVHATGGQPAHYEAAIKAAQKYRRVLLIEATSAHAEAWRTAATFGGAKRIIILLPTDGVHPRPAVHQ